MFSFLHDKRNNPNDDLVHDMARRLAYLEGVIEVYRAALFCIIARMDAPRREALNDSMIESLPSGYPSWMGHDRATVYHEGRTAAMDRLMQADEDDLEDDPPQSN